MSVVTFVCFESVEDFNQSSFRIEADTVFDPIDFFIGVTIWMRGQRAMGFVS